MKILLCKKEVKYLEFQPVLLGLSKVTNVLVSPSEKTLPVLLNRFLKRGRNTGNKFEDRFNSQGSATGRTSANQLSWMKTGGGVNTIIATGNCQIY